MRYLEKTFGEAPEGEKSLWISMHGGGGAPPQINDQQWLNQIRLYAPQEGIVIAPRGAYGFMEPLARGPYRRPVPGIDRPIRH
jgi:hypothetical protein